MKHLEELLSAHLDGELSAVESEMVTTHLVGCPVCAAELEQLAFIRESIRGLPLLDVPDRPRRAAPVVARWRWAAASLAASALAVGLVVGPGVESATFDMTAVNQQHVARVLGDPGIASLRGTTP